MTSVVVGTSNTCDLQLPGPFLSPRHLEIYGTPGTVWVRDLGSTNGTMVKSGPYAHWTRAAPALPLYVGGRIVAGRVLIAVLADGRVWCAPNLNEDELAALML